MRIPNSPHVCRRTDVIYLPSQISLRILTQLNDEYCLVISKYKGVYVRVRVYYYYTYHYHYKHLL